MYSAIHSYDEQAFDDMSEKSGEKKNFLVTKLLRSEQAKKHGGFRPQRGNPGNA